MRSSVRAGDVNLRRHRFVIGPCREKLSTLVSELLHQAVVSNKNHSLRRRVIYSMDTLAERSKAVAQGAIPKGRGFEPHSCHFV